MKKLFSMKNLAVLILAAVVTFLTSCNEPSTISKNNLETSELQGVLINELNEPIPNAVMELVQVAGGKVSVQSEDIIERDTTDEDGNYDFKKVPADLSNVDLVIIHQDLQPYRVNLGEMLKGKDVKRVIVQAKYKKECCGQITINVFSASDSSAINDVAVKLYVDKDLQRKAMTDDKGIYTFYEVCKNEYWLKLIKKGYQTAIVENIVVKGCEENDYVNLTVYLKQNNEKDSCCDGTIKVFPKDKETGETIKGTFVKLWQNDEILQKKENADDYVLFENVCEGEYELVLMKDGYNTQEIRVAVDCNEDKEITVEMEKKECCNGVMTVKVQDKDKNAISKAEVRLWFNGKKIKVGATNSDGLIKFTGLCEGKYGVDIMKEGYKGIEFSKEMRCNDSVEIVKTLTLSEQDSCCNGVVKVLVRDEDKKAVEYAKVILWKDGKALEDGKTNGDGYMVFDGLCEGDYGMSIQREGYKTIEFEFKLDCNEQKTFEKVMQKDSQDSCCKGVVKVLVRDEDKKAVEYAKVILWKNGKALEDGKTNGDGYIVFDGLCEGDYGMSIQREGYKTIEFEFKLDCNEQKTFEKVMQKDNQDSCCNGVMTVKVQDNDKNAISKAEVRLWFNGEKIKVGATNSDGVIKFTGLCEGKYGVDIMKEGYKGIEFSKELRCNDTVEIIKTLALSEQDSCCNGVVKVIVRDEDKKGVEYAKVILLKDGKALQDGKTNGDGYMVFDGLCEGEYGMLIKREGYKTIEFEFKLDCNEQKTFEKVLTKDDSCCTAIMKLIIVNENEEAIEGAKVEVYFERKIIEDGESDRGGHWVMDGLCAPATYTVVVKKDGYQSQEFKMEYTECKAIAKTVVMKK